MGGLIQALAPKGFDMAGKLAPAFGKAWDEGSAARRGDRTVTDGYEAPRGGEAESAR